MDVEAVMAMDREVAVPLQTIHDTDFHLRPVVSARLARRIRRLTADLPLIASDDRAESIADSLARDGCIELGPVLSPAQANAMRKRIASLPVYPAQDDGEDGAMSVGEAADRHHFAHLGKSDLHRLPGLYDLLLSNDVLSAVTAYLGCLPTLYQVHALWTFPQTHKADVIQTVHRDIDDYRSVVFFLYLTDVHGPQDGSHQYLRRSSELAGLSHALGDTLPPETISRLFFSRYEAEEYIDFDAATSKPFITDFNGPAGTVFLTDGFGFHRACLPTTMPRLLLMARFGLLRKEGYHDLKHDNDLTWHSQYFADANDSIKYVMRSYLSEFRLNR